MEIALPDYEMPDQEIYTQSTPTTFMILPKGKIVHKQMDMAGYYTRELRDVLQARPANVLII